MLCELPIFRHPERDVIHYLAAYLGAVVGGLSQRGMVIHGVEITPTPPSLGGSIALDPPRLRADINAPAWVTYQASWDEHRGWCCHLRHIGRDQSRYDRYLGAPLVPAPDAVADFIAGLRRVHRLGTLGLDRPGGYSCHTPQELADDLVRFTPTCTWIG